MASISASVKNHFEFNSNRVVITVDVRISSLEMVLVACRHFTRKLSSLKRTCI